MGNQTVKSLVELIEISSSVAFGNTAKRLTLPDGKREWVVRVYYHANTPKGSLESPWEGFDTVKSAIEDLIRRYNASS